MKKLFLVMLVVFLASLYMAVDLTMYVGGDEMRVKLSPIVEIYEKEHPNVNIDVVVLPYYGGFMEKISLSIMSGDVPDLIEISTGYIFQVDDYLINLAPYIQEELGLSAKEFSEQLYLMPRYCVEREDSIIAVPLNYSVQGLWVNKEMFEKAGISYPPLGGREEPWSWEEFKGILSEVKKANKIPYALSMDYSADRFLGFLSLWDIKILDEDLNFVWDTYENAEEVLEEFLNLFKDGYIPKAEWLSGQAADQDFFSGRTAMYWSGNWQLYQVLDISESTGKEYDAAYLPQINNWFGLPGGGFLGAFKTGNSEKEQAAVDFLIWMADPNGGYKEFLKYNNELSSYKNLTVDYQNEKVNDWLKVFQDLGETYPEWAVISRAQEVGSRLYYEPLRKQLSLGIAGQVTPKEIIENTKAEYERIMEDLEE